MNWFFQKRKKVCSSLTDFPSLDLSCKFLTQPEVDEHETAPPAGEAWNSPHQHTEAGSKVKLEEEKSDTDAALDQL